MVAALRPLNPKETIELHEAKGRLGLLPADGPLQCSFELRDIRRKGRGYVATHGIKAGTLIIEEPHLFTVDAVEDEDDGEEISPATIARINNAVQQLTPDQRRQYRDLDQPFPGRTAHPDIGIFLANNFEMTPSTKTHGIFLRASRLNHSCLPNAWFNWNPRHKITGRRARGSLTVYAMKDISRKEEIVVNYQNAYAYMEASVRQGRLRAHYNFKCTCEACTPGGLHAARRLDMETDARRIEQYNGDDQTLDEKGQQHLRERSLIDLRDLVKEEGLVYPYKADVCGQLAEMLLEKMERNRGHPRFYNFQMDAREAFRGRLEAEIVSLGEDSPEVRETLRLMRKLYSGRQ
ncbi:MAG: hypothetical protein Q9221_004950 [Calogaya cf. arnoldii]